LPRCKNNPVRNWTQYKDKSLQPTTAISNFELNPRLLTNLTQLGFTQTTSIQNQCLPLIFAQKDLLVSSHTGSGKTLAYLIPALNLILSKPVYGTSTRALVLVPNRELAHQILSLANKLIKRTHMRLGLMVGGEAYQFQQALLRKSPELIIATPGRFMEHQSKGHTDTSALELLVIDEADRMLELGFCEDVKAIALACNRQRQTLLFSATLNTTKVLTVASHLLRNPVTIELNASDHVQRNLAQEIIFADNQHHKERLLVWLLANESASKILIFCNSRRLVKHLATYLSQQHHEALALHGELAQDERNRILRLYRQHQFNILVATEVAARGLDIKGLALIINFDMPRNQNDYLHRIGRTGRANTKGVAISLVGPNETQLLIRLEQQQRRRFSVRQIKGLTARQSNDTQRSPRVNPPIKRTKTTHTAIGDHKQRKINWDGGFAPLSRKP
jgi:ATP-dependent RNA helicase SrmB